MHKLADLRVGDVMVFLSVVRCQSVNAAARELDVQPSQVSKAVGRLEVQLGVSLLVRSQRGVTLSDAGNRLLPQLTELVQRVQELDRRDGVDTAIAIAAPSYIISWSAPCLAEALQGDRVRAIQMAPSLIRTLSSRNLFDVCITLADETLPESWASVKVGEMRRACFGPPALAARLGPAPVALESIRDVPFVLPVYNENGIYIPVDDGCPLKPNQRKAGHEAPTMALALELASATEQLVFGPLLAAFRHIAEGRMVEIAVDGWEISDPVYVAFNVDRVRTTQQRLITDALTAALARYATRD